MIYFVGGYADMLCKIEKAWTEGCLAAQAVCELVSFDEISGIFATTWL